MKSSFTLTKLDDINLRSHKIYLKDYRVEIKKILDIILNTKELYSSRIFNGEISKISFDVAFCNDETIRELNKTYRNKDKATDVITFSLFFDDFNSVIYRKTANLGQIIISVETAYRQKDENNNDLRKEILTLLIHGILHLLGFDHLTKKDYDFVVSIQNKVLRQI